LPSAPLKAVYCGINAVHDVKRLRVIRLRHKKQWHKKQRAGERQEGAGFLREDQLVGDNAESPVPERQSALYLF
jgi:hypothetical protein